MKFRDYYQVLEVERNASQDEIKRAYRKLARKYHPDVSKEADAEARFKEVGEAYEVLKDAEKRTAYDQFGQDWKAGQDFKPPPGWDAGYEFSGPGGGASDFSDFFESLFGAGRMGGFSRGSFSEGSFSPGSFSQGPRRTKGQDHHARIMISLADAYTGDTRTLTLQAPEVSAHGHVSTRKRSIKVRIPKGVTEGQRIRLAGQGSAGTAGGPAGNLYLEVRFEPHAFFSAEGRNILLNLPVTPWEVALGATVQVPTLGGPVELKIPAGSQSGNKLRLKKRGLPGHPAGDQIVTLRLETPTADTDEKRALYERMRDELPMNPRRNLGV
jgi:curved DNA-binding protein